MSKLFENSSINGMNLPNRFVRSATWEGMATTDGAVTPKLIETITNLAIGGVGLIISSHAYVSPEGQGSPWQLGMYKDELIDGLKALTAAVHKNGGKIVMQLAHAGNFARKNLINRPPLIVSNLDDSAKSPQKEMTSQEIQRIVIAFAKAAQRAQSAGFDGVQIHSAHGYLLSQFLSPLYNKRQDKYGGNIQNRVKIHLETYEAVRNSVGHDYPVLIKMNCEDMGKNGLSPEGFLQAAKMFANVGFDAIELSGGITRAGKFSPIRTGINSEDKEAYFKKYAHLLKKEINVPLMLVGGIRSFEVADRLITEGVADYISMSRPFIREPGLINRWKSGDRQKAKCVSENSCFDPGMNGKGIYCVTKEREEKSEKHENN
ncbi:MAG: NADH:flavin oxidoreductase [Thermodesulfobacteriota bacterium]|nr:NADH:flavin oxidoreductase [Thermodesulfobacteriota bacterium]